jgi:hypothetical protein
VATLDSTEAVTPKASRRLRAPTGSCKLSRIDGHSRPRIELGSAILRYARQARTKGGTAGNILRVDELRSQGPDAAGVRACARLPGSGSGEIAVPQNAAERGRSSTR